MATMFVLVVMLITIPQLTTQALITPSNINNNTQPLVLSNLTQSSNSTTKPELVDLQDPQPCLSEYLLLGTANSIRYWPTECRPHSLSSLLMLNRSSSLKHGISGFTIWRRPSANRTFSTELLWFDVHDDRLYRASIQHNKTASCGQSQLSLGETRSIRFLENPFHVMVLNDTSHDHLQLVDEKLVKLSIDNTNQVLFLSNLLQNRIDIYRLLVPSSNDEQEAASWIGFVDTHRPFDISLDESLHRLFWISNRSRICSMFYGDISHGENGTHRVQCLHISSDSQRQAAALAVDASAKQLYWIERNEAQIRRLDNYEQVKEDNKHIGDPVFKVSELSTVWAMDLDVKKRTFFVNDQFEVMAIDVQRGEQHLVQVELSSLFDLKLVDLDHFEDSESSPETSTSTTSASTHETSTSITTDASTPETSTTTTDTPQTSTLSRLKLVEILMITCSIIALVIICICIRSLWRHRNPQDNWSRFQNQDAETCCRMRKMFLRCCRWTRDNYDHLSSRRTSSVGSLSSIATTGVSSIDNRETSTARQQHEHYRSNIVSSKQAPGLSEDIEDIFNSPSISSVHPCLACREPELCVEKGLCMVTYRIQQQQAAC